MTRQSMIETLETIAEDDTVRDDIRVNAATQALIFHDTRPL